MRQYEKAKELIDEALSAKPDGTTYIAITLARLDRLSGQKDDKNRIEKMLEAGLASAHGVRGFPELAFGAVAVGWAELQDPAKCIGVLEESRSSFYKGLSFRQRGAEQNELRHAQSVNACLTAE